MNPYRSKGADGAIWTKLELNKQDFRQVAVFYSVWRKTTKPQCAGA